MDIIQLCIELQKLWSDYNFVSILIDGIGVSMTIILIYVLYKQIKLYRNELKHNFNMDSFKIVVDYRKELKDNHSELINDIVLDKNLVEIKDKDIRDILNIIEILGTHYEILNMDIMIIHELLGNTIIPIVKHPDFAKKMEETRMQDKHKFRHIPNLIENLKKYQKEL